MHLPGRRQRRRPDEHQERNDVQDAAQAQGAEHLTEVADEHADHEVPWAARDGRRTAEAGERSARTAALVRIADSEGRQYEIAA
jgi:hypothetical protein